MLKWIIITSVLIAGAVAGFFYVQMQNGGAVPNLPLHQNTPSAPNAVRIEHSFKDGVHKFRGKVRLAHSCYTVTPQVTVNPTDPTKFTLSLTTVDHLLDMKICSQFVTPYEFETIGEGVEKITLTLKVNNRERPLDLVETPWQMVNEFDRH